MDFSVNVIQEMYLDMSTCQFKPPVTLSLTVPRQYSHLSLNKCLFVSVCPPCVFSHLHSCYFLVLVLCCSGGWLLCMLFPAWTLPSHLHQNWYIIVLSRVPVSTVVAYYRKIHKCGPDFLAIVFQIIIKTTTFFRKLKFSETYSYLFFNNSPMRFESVRISSLTVCTSWPHSTNHHAQRKCDLKVKTVYSYMFVCFDNHVKGRKGTLLRKKQCLPRSAVSTLLR